MGPCYALRLQPFEIIGMQGPQELGVTFIAADDGDLAAASMRWTAPDDDETALDCVFSPTGRVQHEPADSLDQIGFGRTQLATVRLGVTIEVDLEGEYLIDLWGSKNRSDWAAPQATWRP